MSTVGDWMIDVGSLLHEVESAAPIDAVQAVAVVLSRAPDHAPTPRRWFRARA